MNELSNEKADRYDEQCFTQYVSLFLKDIHSTNLALTILPLFQSSNLA